jgi:hypothetical protein
MHMHEPLHTPPREVCEMARKSWWGAEVTHTSTHLAHLPDISRALHAPSRISTHPRTAWASTITLRMASRRRMSLLHNGPFAVLPS